MRLFAVGLFWLLLVFDVRAADTLAKGPPPAWVQPVALRANPAADTLGAFRAELFEQQFHFDADGWHLYVRTRMVIQSPQALSAFGTVGIQWNPAFQSVTVHGVTLHRGSQVIDVLAGQDFVVLRREANLESATLDGQLTGTLQLNDLRVGDTIETSYTFDTRIPVLGDHAEFITTGAVPAVVDQYALRGSWPTTQGLRLRVSEGWDAPTVRRRGARSEIGMDLFNLEPLLVPEDAPARFHQVRQLELTDYGSWGDIGNLFAPLYDRASILAPDSPLHAEIERIRSASSARPEQVAAVLRLVQDEVRYLALAMGDGGLVPATADETWTRRLGDCKAKTALLLALLRELGVTARPVLVSTVDNALDRRLPIVGAFDHVIVQAEVDGAMVWLDGTRSGDRAIADLATPAYGWVLPVGTGGDLVRIDEVPLRQAQRETILTFDATGGLYADTAVSGEMIYRGDFATLLQSQLSGAPAGQRDAYMRASWTELVDELQITSVRADYDREANLVRLTMAGTAKLDWSSAGSRRLEVPMSRLSWSVGSRRPEGPYRDLPVATNHPWFTRFRTVLVLPNQGEGFRTFGTDIDETQAGYSYLRTTSLVGGVITMDRSVRSLTSELTEADRAAAVDPLERLSRGKAEIIAPSNYQATPQDMTAWESDTPTTSREYVARGLALNDTRQPDQALAAFDRAIEIEPSNANAWANRGIVKFWQGNEEAAGRDFNKALELNPAERVALNGRGLLAMKQERFAEAVEAFSDSLEQSESEDPWALSMRSNAYLGLGDYERALTDTRRLRSLQPDRLETALLEVTILLATERLSEANELAESLAALHPDEPSVLLGLARLKSMQSEHPAADRAYSAVLAVTPEDTNVLIARAETRVLMGDAAGARADLQTARGLSGDDADLLNGLCWTQAVARFDLEQALADCDAALRIMPDSAGIIDSRGLVLLRMERHADAIAAYNQALALQADQPTSLYGRGQARLALGLTAEGQADIDAAVAIYPDVASELEPSAQIGIPIRD